MKTAKLFLFLISIYLLFAAKPAFAATLSLEPASGSYSVNQNFDVKVQVNTEGENTTSADAVLKFNQDTLEVVNISGGTFYPQSFKSIFTGKVYVGGAVERPTDFKTGSGDLATITFKGKTEGSVTVTFDCTPGKTSDSNISKNDSQATDILDCAKIGNGSYTITAGTGDTNPTPRPTFGPICGGDVTANCQGGGITNLFGKYERLHLTGKVGDVTVIDTNQTSWTWSDAHYNQYFRNTENVVNFTLNFYQDDKVINTITKTAKIGLCEAAGKLPEAGTIETTFFLLGAGLLLTILGLAITL